MDKLDAQIIEVLENDSRRTFTEIADELKVSDATIHMRVKRLVAEGVIKKFTVAVDYRKLGYQESAFIEIRIAPGTIEKVTNVLMSLEGIVDIYELHSHCDLLIKVRVRDLEELRDIVVRRLRNVLREDLVSDDVYAVLRVIRENEPPQKNQVDTEVGSTVSREVRTAGLRRS